jgi:uncharacterized membrane protein YphA (DoxX/SURF4 family)
MRSPPRPTRPRGMALVTKRVRTVLVQEEKRRLMGLRQRLVEGFSRPAAGWLSTLAAAGMATGVFTPFTAAPLSVGRS